MKTIVRLLVVFALLTPAFSQETTRPQAVVEGGVILNGSGMTAAGGLVQAGPYWDAKHFLFISEAGYSTGGKVDDNSNTSSKGHTRRLQSDLLFKKGQYFFGVGTSWSKFYTPDYTKSSVHPRIDVGRDFTGGYVNRVLVSYVGAGTDTANAIQGFEARAYWFLGKHAFARVVAGGYFGHTTVIPVSQGGSPQSVASELASKTATSQAQFTLGCRF